MQCVLGVAWGTAVGPVSDSCSHLDNLPRAWGLRKPTSLHSQGWVGLTKLTGEPGITDLPIYWCPMGNAITRHSPLSELWILSLQLSYRWLPKGVTDLMFNDIKSESWGPHMHIRAEVACQARLLPADRASPPGDGVWMAWPAFICVTLGRHKHFYCFYFWKR